jgi:hypothetical protein
MARATVDFEIAPGSYLQPKYQVQQNRQKHQLHVLLHLKRSPFD